MLKLGQKMIVSWRALVLSLLLAEHWLSVLPPHAFFHMPSRFWELAAGALVVSLGMFIHFYPILSAAKLCCGRPSFEYWMWLRSWRYVQMDITTADEPLHLVDMRSQFTAYPFEQKATFSSDAAWLAKVWQLNWRSLRLSAFETFWDTPYYEQLQYVGDARIAALLAVYQTGDGRLLRNAIEQFDASRIRSSSSRMVFSYSFTTSTGRSRWPSRA